MVGVDHCNLHVLGENSPPERKAPFTAFLPSRPELCRGLVLIPVGCKGPSLPGAQPLESTNCTFVSKLKIFECSPGSRVWG